MRPSPLALPLPSRPFKRLPLALFMAGCASGSMTWAADETLRQTPRLLSRQALHTPMAASCKR